MKVSQHKNFQIYDSIPSMQFFFNIQLIPGYDDDKNRTKPVKTELDHQSHSHLLLPCRFCALGILVLSTASICFNCSPCCSVCKMFIDSLLIMDVWRQ